MNNEHKRELSLHAQPAYSPLQVMPSVPGKLMPG
jgi:hypothetical protein